MPLCLRSFFNFFSPPDLEELEELAEEEEEEMHEVIQVRGALCAGNYLCVLVCVLCAVRYAVLFVVCCVLGAVLHRVPCACAVCGCTPQLSCLPSLPPPGWHYVAD